jgi:hypothetical protein
MKQEIPGDDESLGQVCQLGAKPTFPHYLPSAMSFAQLLRRPCTCGYRRILQRHSSTSAISDERMRALISLYHQSETFITKENLDRRIDEAFTGGTPKPVAAGDSSGLSYQTLWTTVSERRGAPYFVDTMDEQIKEVDLGTYIDTKNTQVAEALYGVEAGHGYELGNNTRDVRFPSLDTLRETAYNDDEPRVARAGPPTDDSAAELQTKTFRD